jgi:predicted MPP superfamily phosphohydrolase
MVVTRRALLRAGIGGGVAVVGGLSAWGVVARRRLSVTRVDVVFAGLPASLDGLRIAILTDLHHSEFVSQEDIAAAVQLANGERPDLVALLGDYVTWGDRSYIGGCIEALASLSAPEGIFAIFGNHDDERTTMRAMVGRGWEVLTDERTDIRVRDESLTVAGLRYWTRKASDVRRVVAGGRGPTLLLAHDPRRLVEASQFQVPLVLSGHTHGGQIVLPLVGAIAARKYPVAQGMARRNRTTLFVSRGIGTVFVPMRLNCPPEVAVVRLRVGSRQ